jgi:predicted nicotinamide N-methyase
MTFDETYRFTHEGIVLQIEAARDLDALLADDMDADRIPFWAVLWDSAPVLTRWLLERGECSGMPVLELGCGAGLVGLALAAAGARVTQTDRFPEAVALARKNAHRNAITNVYHAAADWRAWPLQGRWPVVVASDVAYERPCHGPLLDVLGETVARGGTAFIADPGRPMSGDLFCLAEAEGWFVTEEPAQRGGSGDAVVCVYALRRGDPE